MVMKPGVCGPVRAPLSDVTPVVEEFEPWPRVSTTRWA